MLLEIIIASLVVSAVSLVSIFFILYEKKISTKTMNGLVAFASGILLAVVFLELLPEVFEKYTVEPHQIFLVILLSIISFYIIERLIHWHHCHGHKCSSETRVHVAYTNLIGDGIHNAIDGVLIGASFLVSPEIGVATTIAVLAHEIPQEISDASVLLYAGFSKFKIILSNFIFSLTALLGAVLAYFFANQVDNFLPILIAIASGNFIYLSLADLIPELHREHDTKTSFIHSLWLIIGVAVFWITNSMIGHI